MILIKSNKNLLTKVNNFTLHLILIDKIYFKTNLIQRKINKSKKANINIIMDKNFKALMLKHSLYMKKTKLM